MRLDLLSSRWIFPFGMFRHLRRDRPGKEQLWNRLGDSHRQVYRHDFDSIKSTRQERKFEKREAGNPIRPLILWRRLFTGYRAAFLGVSGFESKVEVNISPGR